MNLLPKASGTRPRVACEIAPQGVVAARSDEAAAPLAAVSRVLLQEGAVVPGLRPGNIVDRVAVTAALRKALEDVGAKPNTRNADITVVIPDGACRVLLLDFDSLPNKLSEALPIVRFRLKKLLPFEADDAMVSFQIMSTSKQLVRVLAVAIPRDVLSEYEAAAREAGFEPGSVIPSTLATMASVTDEGATMVVNVNRLGITAAIARDGILMLHRTVDLQAHSGGIPADLPPALFETADGHTALPLVSVEATQGEWAAQEPLPEHGRNPYADRIADEEAAQNYDGVTAMQVPHLIIPDASLLAHPPAEEPAPIENSPYAQPTVAAELSAELHNSILIAPTSLGSLTDPAAAADLRTFAEAALSQPAQPHVHTLAEEGIAAEPLPEDVFSSEVAQAVSVAAAYYEDSLAAMPETVLCAGSFGADALKRILSAQDVSEADGLRVRELVRAEDIAADAASSKVARGWLAGVLGALRG